MKATSTVYFHTAKVDFSIDNFDFKVGQVVYIGSGTTIRLNSKTDRSESHLKVWNLLDKNIIHFNLTVDESFELEQKYLDAHWNSGLLNKRHKVHKVKPILHSEISEVYYLDNNGTLLWKIDRMGGIRMKIFSARKDTPAGCIGKKGYWNVRFNRSTFKLHRVVWVLANQQDLCPSLTIDHIDGNKSNNHPSNLRAVSQQTNNRNINRKVKPSELNIPRIRFSEKQMLFHVQWTTSEGKKTHKYFTMKSLIKEGMTYNDAYDKCFKDAIEFNNNLGAIYE